VALSLGSKVRYLLYEAMLAPRPRPLAHAVLLILATYSGAAAQGSGEIRGHVVNAANQTPVAMATVYVGDSGASASPTQASTDANGLFRVAGLREGRYHVRIVAIGYTPREIAPIAIGASAPSVDLGTVALAVSPIQLQSIIVRGQQQSVELAPDRNIYVVRDMPTTRGGTALDVLRNVPAVDVDIDNVVSLRGNTGVVLQINGRPSPLKPAQLGNFLAQLPADMVDKVEVIPNPSARENPEGVAGIINIVLKQNADEGRTAVSPSAAGPPATWTSVAIWATSAGRCRYMAAMASCATTAPGATRSFARMTTRLR